MKDAFGVELKVGDKVIYSIGNSYGTSYIIGKISKFHLKEVNTRLDRVSISVTKCSYERGSTRDPMVLTENVVKLSKDL